MKCVLEGKKPIFAVMVGVGIGLAVEHIIASKAIKKHFDEQVYEEYIPEVIQEIMNQEDEELEEVVEQVLNKDDKIAAAQQIIKEEGYGETAEEVANRLAGVGDMMRKPGIVAEHFDIDEEEEDDPEQTEESEAAIKPPEVNHEKNLEVVTQSQFENETEDYSHFDDEGLYLYTRDNVVTDSTDNIFDDPKTHLGYEAEELYGLFENTDVIYIRNHLLSINYIISIVDDYFFNPE